MLPIVELTRSLSESSTYDLLLKQLEQRGFERLQLNVPIRKDVAKFGGTSVFKKGDTSVLVAQAVGKEAGRNYAMLSLTVTDTNAHLAETLAEVSEWLGAEPEYPARGAQFAVLENTAAWTPISLSETTAWRERPVGSLAQTSVDDAGSGVSIIRVVTKAI